MFKIVNLGCLLLVLAMAHVAHAQDQAVNQKDAIELVQSLTKLTLDEIDCYYHYNAARDFTDLFEKFFTNEFTHLLLWGKSCSGYKLKPREIRADAASLVGTTILFGEFSPPRNDGIPIWKYRTLSFSANKQKNAVIVNANYKINGFPTWTKFTVIPTQRGPRIDDIELNGAGYDYEVYAVKIKSMKSKLSSAYSCTQKQLRKCSFLFD